MKLLHIDSSALGGGSVSRQLTAAVVDGWRQARPDVQVVYRDLAANPPPHFSPALVGAMFGKPEDLSDAQRADLALSEELVSEFLAADAVVIGAPMYNFSIPSQLKAWIDRIAQKGRTFAYSEKGPVGLAGGKQVIIASSRGGIYSDGARQAMDFQEAYLRGVLAFLGVTDVTMVRAEGVNISPEAKAQAVAAAHAEAASLFRKAA
jgi:FMN-dependent NADH-azoreductase